MNSRHGTAVMLDKSYNKNYLLNKLIKGLKHEDSI